MLNTHALLYLPLKGGGRFANEVKQIGWGSNYVALNDPLPNPPPFRGRESTNFAAH